MLANLEQRRRNGLLGSSVCSQPGFDFDIEIHPVSYTHLDVYKRQLECIWVTH